MRPHPCLAKTNHPFYDYRRAVFKYNVPGIRWDFPVSEIAEFPDSGVLTAGREIKRKDEVVFGNSLGRLVIGGWLAATVWILPTIPPVSEGVRALSVQARPLEYILAHADLVVRVRLLTIEPVYYISDNLINPCALEIKATTLEVLKGNIEQGETLKFLAGYSGMFLEGITPYLQSSNVELTNPEIDIFPTEYLVFLTSGQEGINASELEHLDSVKGSYRSCLVLRYQREGFHTVAFERPGTFDRWAEKQFGGKWVGLQYEFPNEKEEIEIREVQFGPTIHHTYGVTNWEDYRRYLIRLIREQGE